MKKSEKASAKQPRQKAQRLLEAAHDVVRLCYPSTDPDYLLDGFGVAWHLANKDTYTAEEARRAIRIALAAAGRARHVPTVTDDATRQVMMLQVVISDILSALDVPDLSGSDDPMDVASAALSAIRELKAAANNTIA